MKSNKNKMNISEKAVAFRAKKEDRILTFCLYQSNLYDRMLDDDDVVYIDFQNDAEIDSLINALQVLKSSPDKKDEGEDRETII